jgi:Uma2 family endonuclease
MKHALEAEKQRCKQFYANIYDDMKAESINGEVIVHSPVKKEHTDVTLHITQLINAYVQIHDIGYVGYEKVMTSFTRNDYEPDVVFLKNQNPSISKKVCGSFLFLIL